ncbi:hypothetical protein Fot_24287 [Forsythia ovata]|uniref:Uncharacterized protein n=1 Tax=Forsythia ovata TaxID=205694 RepID=A0ABD1U5S4_9LAMI
MQQPPCVELDRRLLKTSLSYSLLHSRESRVYSEQASQNPYSKGRFSGISTARMAIPYPLQLPLKGMISGINLMPSLSLPSTRRRRHLQELAKNLTLLNKREKPALML